MMIRAMKKQDWSGVTRIFDQSLRRGDVTFTTECPTYEEWDADHIRECRFVYESEGQVVGYAMIAPTSKREPYRGVVESSVFVDEDHHRRGIGTALLTRIGEAGTGLSIASHTNPKTIRVTNFAISLISIRR